MAAGASERLGTTPNPELDLLRELVEELAPLDRRAGSPAEKRAAELIADRLNRVGAPARVEEELFRDGYARLLLPLGTAGALAGSLALTRGWRARSALIAAAATAAMVDDVSNGPRVWRRLASRPRPTWNVVAEAGDRNADRTLVVLAHHDAAPTGRVFDQTLQREIARRLPHVIERTDTSFPLWWPVTAGPALIALGAASGRRAPLALGTALAAASVALGVDIARSAVVPGANDNLSGVAALVALAERLRHRPVEGVRVLLASCGAEEVLQGGIYGFAARHLQPLDPRRTWVVNLDSIGSPELILAEAEGPFRMEEYTDAGFRDTIARVARAATGAPLRRGVRARASTDAVIPSRAGFPTALIASWEPDTKLISNYHLPTDTPENVRYESVARAVDIVEAVARELAGA